MDQWIHFPLSLDNGRSPYAYVNQSLQLQLELLMMSGMPLETWWAFNKRWNDKFYYKVASCWLFWLIHTAMHGSMNIKYTYMPNFKCWFSLLIVAKHFYPVRFYIAWYSRYKTFYVDYLHIYQLWQKIGNRIVWCNFSVILLSSNP